MKVKVTAIKNPGTQEKLFAEMFSVFAPIVLPHKMCCMPCGSRCGGLGFSDAYCDASSQGGGGGGHSHNRNAVGERHLVSSVGFTYSM